MIAINKTLFVFFIFGGTIAHATPVKCTNPDATTFDGIYSCLYEDYKFYDKQLNKIYQEKLLVLNTKRKNNLKILERAWIQQKDYECNSLVDEKNYGKESHFSAIECMTNMTKDRIEFLKKYK